jgi:hypothetical protein
VRERDQILVREHRGDSLVARSESLKAFRDIVRAAPAPGWMWLDDEPRSLGVFFAEPRAFVMALAEPGDVGEVAVDPAAADDATPIAFTIDNGQVDTWPAAATVGYEQAEQVIAAWARGARFDGVCWTDAPPGLP